MLAIAEEHKLRGMLFWLMGDLGQSTVVAGPDCSGRCADAGHAFCPRTEPAVARLMQAQALGVAVGRLRYAIYLLASLATAASVTTAGSIGFVGLVVPTWCGWPPATTNACCCRIGVGGGSLLVLADTLARTLLAPQQLPVGVLTALIGVPVFLFLLSRQPK
jgi:iron complex transport system permease protein